MIRLGVVGYGRRCKGLINLFREVEPDIRVVGVVDSDEAGAKSRMSEEDKDAVFYSGLAEMASKGKLDGLIIATRCNLHTPYAIEAAKYDIPLYLEKPVAVSMEQAVSLEKGFENAKCPVVVSFPLRTSPLCQITNRYLREDRIGNPEHICATNYVSYGTVYWKEGYRDYDVTRGLFLQKATHDFDYMMYLMDSPIVRVAAMDCKGRVFGGDKPASLKCSECGEADTCPESPANMMRGHYGSDADHVCLFSEACGNPETGMNEDSSSALVQFASGAHGVYTQVFYTRRDAHERGAKISGYKGTLDFNWYTNDLKYVRHFEPFSDVIKADEGMSHFGGDHELAHDFFGIIKGKGESRTPIETGLRSVYSCLAAQESAETGQFVRVRQVGS